MTRLIVLLLVVVLGVSGCGGSGLYGAPLPGGADIGGRPIRVTAEFADVLDLVPQSSVRLNDVPVGRVEGITLSPDGSVALVDLVINGDARIPGNARAELRTASLLGEKFVALGVPPGAAPVGSLREGDRIPLAETRRHPEVEEVLGALSLLLNGGGLAQLRDVIREVNAATGGNEPQLRSLLGRLAELTGRLDAQRATIVRAIDALGRLSTSLAGQTDHITVALDQLGPGLKVLEEQRTDLVSMLKALDRLSGVAVSTVNRGRDDLLADLRALRPTLRELAKAGDDIPNSLQMLLSYPFPDYALKSLKGDYFNTDVRLDFDLNQTLGNLLRSSQPIVPIPGSPAQPLPIPNLPAPLGLQPPAGSDPSSAGTPRKGLEDLLSPLTGGSR
ncbi:MCE family protein [Pseudonocardia acaciae]|uniref:MCE family protein n=1 Tax=Pseudonocardia acaciae TaxID=551276 RepID=UPI000562B2D0|nr:MCE family protein [Pseudonocardia acaciae]